MDEADVGNECMEKWLEAQISEFQYQLNQAGNIEEEQVCRNCQEPLPEGQHFCNLDCRSDFEVRLKAEKRRGREV